MDNTTKYDWVDFYKELAGRLLQYKSNHQGLVEVVRRIYETTGINMPTLELGGNLIDIDPFTFYGIFNKSKMKESNRKSLLSAVASLLGVSTPVPTAFDGIPVLNNQNATFYYFIDSRGENDINDLWELFESALAYSNNPIPENRERISHYFNLTINKKGNGNSKITMGLYWIAPDSFLNLDRRNEWYIYKSGKIPTEIVDTLPTIEAKISATKYFDILEKLRTYLHSGKAELRDFLELSSAAWQYSEEVNEQNRKTEKESEGAAIADNDIEITHYWIYSPGDGAAYWNELYEAGIMAIGWDIGKLKDYSSKEQMKQAMKERFDPNLSYKNAAHAIWQFANEMKPGDIVFVKKGMHLVVGRGVVESDYYYDESQSDFRNVRKVKWTHKGEWKHPGQAVMKTLTDITQYTEYVEKLNDLFESDIDDDVEETEVTYPAYDEEQFLDEVYMDAGNYSTLVSLLRNKKNVILQGAPGVGKTYAAQRLAYSMMGEKNKDRVMMIQFHQSYSYEDFIMGYRPTENGFERKAGAFYNFCKKAQDDSENDYFFIIDEINRGNLSKIFGELFMLIENDKRGIGLQLLYSNEKFSVPKNLYIIGMMNTADRSLAMLDYALRRRFAFYRMLPGFETKGFRDYQENLGSLKFDRLIAAIQKLNEAVSADESLGEGFCIGHSYFCNLKEATDQTLSEIIEFEIIPLLEEYWFDEPTKVKNWVSNLRSAIN